MSDHEDFIATLEALGEAEVRQRLARGNIYGVKHAAIVQEWLRSIVVARAETVAATRDAREDETLSIAKDALAIANQANRIASEDLAVARSSADAARANARWAMYAAIIAAIVAAVAAKEEILALFLGPP